MILNDLIELQRLFYTQHSLALSFLQQQFYKSGMNDKLRLIAIPTRFIDPELDAWFAANIDEFAHEMGQDAGWYTNIIAEKRLDYTNPFARNVSEIKAKHNIFEPHDSHSWKYS